MDVRLNRQDEALVASLVTSGQYSDANHVVHDALLLMAAERQRVQFHSKVIEGIADMNAGHVIPAEEVCDRLERKFAAMAVTADHV